MALLGGTLQWGIVACRSKRHVFPRIPVVRAACGCRHLVKPVRNYPKMFHANRCLFSFFAWRRFFVLGPKKRFRRRHDISAVMKGPGRVF
jgi:hypothetical protein